MRHFDHRAPKLRACEEALGAGVPLRRREHDPWRTASFERSQRRRAAAVRYRSLDVRINNEVVEYPAGPRSAM